MTAGYVYILKHPAMGDLLKIGKTTRTPEERARELSGATGVPGQFCVVHQELVPDCDLAERLIHERLSRHRESPNREFFRLPLPEALDALRAIAEEVRRRALPPPPPAAPAAAATAPDHPPEASPDTQPAAPDPGSRTGEHDTGSDTSEVRRLRQKRRESQQQSLHASAVLLIGMVLVSCCVGLCVLTGLSQGSRKPTPPNNQLPQPGPAKPKGR